MSLISEIKDNTDEKGHDRPTVVRNATDLQRLKLEKLMKHPEKAVIIPEKPKERGMPAVPEFVRNVMGSSAGAGSGEFHVYRHLRRKEYARQKFMKERGERDRLEDEYHQKLDDNKRKAEEKTAKRRAKRLKRKGKMKNKKGVTKDEKSSSESEEESSGENEEEKEKSGKVSEDNDNEVNNEKQQVSVEEPEKVNDEEPVKESADEEEEDSCNKL